MEFHNKMSVYDNLSKYDSLAKPDDFIEVTEWTNGEGVIVTINDTTISLTYGQINAINYLIDSLSYHEKV